MLRTLLCGRVTYENSGDWLWQSAGLILVPVQLRNIPFQFFFLGSWRGLTNNIPTMQTTFTGEGFLPKRRMLQTLGTGKCLLIFLARILALSRVRELNEISRLSSPI